MATGVLDDTTDDLPVDDGPQPEGVRRLSGWTLLGCSAAAWWAVGFLPWLLDGLHLPPSKAWTGSGATAAVPLSEQALAKTMVLSMIGGVVAVALARFAGPWVRLPRAVAAAGALLGAGAALLQTRTVAHVRLNDASGSSQLLTALVAFALGWAVIGVVAGLAATGGRPWARLLAQAAAAAMVPLWLYDLVVRGSTPPTGVVEAGVQYVPWVAGVLLGLALAGFGVQPASRLVGWLVALGVTWLVPAVALALVQVGGWIRASTWGPGVIRELLDVFVDYFVAGLSPSGHRFGPLVLAQTLGILGAAVLLARRRKDSA